MDPTTALQSRLSQPAVAARHPHCSLPAQPHHRALHPSFPLARTTAPPLSSARLPPLQAALVPSRTTMPLASSLQAAPSVLPGSKPHSPSGNAPVTPGEDPKHASPVDRANATLMEKFGISVAELPPPSMSVDVAVVGGGLGGLAFAVGLQKRGIPAHVFEAAPALRTDSGTIFCVASHCVAALEGIHEGLGTGLEAAGCLTKATKTCMRAGGAPAIVQERQGNAYGTKFTVPWKSAQQLFASHVAPDLMHCRHRFISFVPAEDGVDAVFAISREGQAQGCSPPELLVVRAQLLVGADGMRSRVRTTLVGDEPRYLRCIDWNSLVHNPGKSKFGGYEQNQIVFARDMDAGLAFFLLDAGNEYAFWDMRIYDNDLATSQALGDDFGGFGKKGNKERVLSLIKAKRQGSHGKGGLSPPQDDGSEQFWRDIQTAIENTESEVIFERFIVDRTPLDEWSSDDGRVVLLGDAAHGMHPGPGQGAQMAFEDGHQLILALERLDWSQKLNGRELKSALTRYEEARVTRTRRVLEFSAEDSGLPEEERAPQDVRQLSADESRRRIEEFAAWLTQYPTNVHGDPHSQYWPAAKA